MLRESECSRTQQKGFSLIELAIVLAVFTFIMGGVFTVLARSQNRYHFEQEVADIQQTARNCIVAQVYRTQRNNDERNRPAV
jgi:prepilin-type N-terminal cleavage/methylation domain-containing protein